MSGKENKGIEVNVFGPGGSYAHAETASHAKTTDGKPVVEIRAEATDERAQSVMNEVLRDAFGEPIPNSQVVQKEPQERSSRGNSVGFDSRKWTAGWTPSGDIERAKAKKNKSN